MHLRQAADTEDRTGRHRGELDSQTRTAGNLASYDRDGHGTKALRSLLTNELLSGLVDESDTWFGTEMMHGEEMEMEEEVPASEVHIELEERFR